MKSIRKIICAGLVVAMIMAMSIPVFAANGARDGTGPNPISQRLRDGTGCGGVNVGTVKLGTGLNLAGQQLRDGTGCGGIGCVGIGLGGTGIGGGIGGGGGRGGGRGGGLRDGSGPLRDGSGGNANCPYLQ